MTTPSTAAPRPAQLFIRPAARWLLPRPAPNLVETLRTALRVSPLVARLLAARGFTDALTAAEFLKPSLTALHDPFALLGMDDAVTRIQTALQRKETILLYGDYDVDGTTSIVILQKALEILGARVSFHVPHRLSEGYGMRADVIERAASEGVRLIISVDTGIRAAAVVRHANILGIDVIITDHHLPDSDLPAAIAVINPNRPGCPYPNKNLCGAGVTLKLVHALLSRSELSVARQTALLESFLKPVAIATVADIVPLTGENRVLVQRGLSGLRDVRNHGLRALLAVAGFDPGECPSAHQVAFRLAPRINAAGRMANARDVIELFLTKDAARAEELAQQLDVLNRDRQKVESDIVDQITAECESMTALEVGSALVFAGENWHAGVLGIVASRLVERFSRPVFVLSNASIEATGLEDLLSGSGRSIPGFHLLEALESMPNLFTKFGGHRQAAGLTLPKASLPFFRSQFAAYAAAVLTDEDLCPQHVVGAEANFSELSDACVQEFLTLGPFGSGNPQPVLLARSVQVAGPPKVIREGKHFTVPLRQERRTLWCKAWNFGHHIALLATGTRLDVLFQIEDDPYSRKRGYESWCVTLKDVRAAA